MSAHRHINSFNAGELSPLMDARGDSDKYQFSCRRLENFIPRIYGGAFRRPGTEYMGTVGDDGSAVRLLPFNYSATTRFVLELGEEYCRFWSNGLRVESGGVAVEVTTPYGAGDLFDVQFVQLNDVCYFAHPDFRPQKLTRNSDTSWTWEEMPMTWPALADENTLSITASVANITVGATTTLTIGDPGVTGGNAIFTAPNSQWIGSYVEIVHRRAATADEKVLTSTGNSAGILILGGYEVYTYGTWSGTLDLQRQRPSGVWETLRTWKSASTRNIIYAGEQLEPAMMRLSFTWVSGTGTQKAVLEASDARVYGLVQITGSTEPVSTSAMRVKIIRAPYATTATELFSLDAWNGRDGHPRSVAFHEQRLMFGGNAANPATFWGSVIGDFENFQRLGNDDSGLSFTLAAQEGSAIQSMVSHASSLVAFTQSEEWLIGSTSNDAALSASNVYARRQSRFGSEYAQAFVANESILFLQRGARKLREFVYSAIEDRSQAADLTLLAEHVTRGGIVQLAFQQQPDPVVWAVTGNGVLLSMTFEREQGVVGWSRHLTAGNVESVAVIYGDPGEADEVWITVAREISGVTVRYVERLDPEAWVKLESSETYRNDFIYSDAAVTVILARPDKYFWGFDHLEGEGVAVLADGAVVEGLTVEGGLLVLPFAATKVIAGLPFESVLQPAKTEINLEDGSSRGRKYLLRRVTLNLWETLGIEYADDPDAPAEKWFPVIGRDMATPMNEAQALFTGETNKLNYGTHQDNLDFTVRQTKPLPANVLSLVAKFDIHGE